MGAAVSNDLLRKVGLRGWGSSASKAAATGSCGWGAPELRWRQISESCGGLLASGLGEFWVLRRLARLASNLIEPTNPNAVTLCRAGCTETSAEMKILVFSFWR